MTEEVSPSSFSKTLLLPTGQKKQAFLKEENIPFWTPQQWPPNSPDLNPLDYAIWSMVQQGACQDRLPSVAALKRHVLKEDGRRPNPRRLPSF